MLSDSSLFVYVRCADPTTAREVLWMACCCRIEHRALRCKMSPLDPICSVDVELTDTHSLQRIRGMPGVLEANPCPAGIPQLCEANEMWSQVMNTAWVHELQPHLVAV